MHSPRGLQSVLQIPHRSGTHYYRAESPKVRRAVPHCPFVFRPSCPRGERERRNRREKTHKASDQVPTCTRNRSQLLPGGWSEICSCFDNTFSPQEQKLQTQKLPGQVGQWVSFVHKVLKICQPCPGLLTIGSSRWEGSQAEAS